MPDLKNAWKNKNVFQKQLDLNLKELQDKESYPPHWNNCILHINNFKPKNILDIGCGCGAFSKVISEQFPDMKYTGMDYSEDAIELAKKTWESDSFIVNDIMELKEEDVSKYDLLFVGALFDVMPNGDEAMEHLMSICSTSMLISRMKLTENESFYTTYTAYDEIETCAYHHSVNNFVDLCEKYSYDIYHIQSDIYLVKR